MFGQEERSGPSWSSCMSEAHQKRRACACWVRSQPWKGIFNQKKCHSLGLGRYLIRLGEMPRKDLLKAKLLQGTVGKICKIPPRHK